MPGDPTELYAMVTDHERLIVELHIRDLSKAERDAFPRVMQNWIVAQEIAKANRRRVALWISASSALTAVLVFIAEQIVRLIPAK